MRKLFLITILLVIIAVTSIAVFRLQKKTEVTVPEATQQETEDEILVDEKGLPLYPGATKILDQSPSTEIWETGDTVSEVAGYYLGVLLDGGWVIKQMPDDPESEIEQIIIAEKPDAAYRITVTGLNSKTQIIIQQVPVEDPEVYQNTAEDIVISVEEDLTPDFNIDE